MKKGRQDRIAETLTPMSEMNGWYLTMRNDPEYYDK